MLSPTTLLLGLALALVSNLAQIQAPFEGWVSYTSQARAGRVNVKSQATDTLFITQDRGGA
jgi:hypothetical protein